MEASSATERVLNRTPRATPLICARGEQPEVTMRGKHDVGTKGACYLRLPEIHGSDLKMWTSEGAFRPD